LQRPRCASVRKVQSGAALGNKGWELAKRAGSAELEKQRGRLAARRRCRLAGWADIGLAKVDPAKLQLHRAVMAVVQDEHCAITVNRHSFDVVAQPAANPDLRSASGAAGDAVGNVEGDLAGLFRDGMPLDDEGLADVTKRSPAASIAMSSGSFNPLTTVVCVPLTGNSTTRFPP
jgi:hypothetical protein